MALKQIIAVRKDLNMRKGKMIAQGSHTESSLIGDLTVHHERVEENKTAITLVMNDDEFDWFFGGRSTKIVVGVESEDELKSLIEQAESKGIWTCPITDAGATEFHGVPTLTCAGFGPDKAEVLDPIFGQLSLL